MNTQPLVSLQDSRGNQFFLIRHHTHAWQVYAQRPYGVRFPLHFGYYTSYEEGIARLKAVYDSAMSRQNPWTHTPACPTSCPACTWRHQFLLEPLARNGV